MASDRRVEQVESALVKGKDFALKAERDPEKQFRMVMDVFRQYLIDLDSDIEGCDADSLRNIESQIDACKRLRARIVGHVCEGKDSRGT